MFKRCKIPQDYYGFAIKLTNSNQVPIKIKRLQISEWLAENCKGAYMMDDEIYRFEIKEDAALFTLFWYD